MWPDQNHKSERQAEDIDRLGSGGCRLRWSFCIPYGVYECGIGGDDDVVDWLHIEGDTGGGSTRKGVYDETSKRRTYFEVQASG